MLNLFEKMSDYDLCKKKFKIGLHFLESGYIDFCVKCAISKEDIHNEVKKILDKIANRNYDGETTTKTTKYAKGDYRYDPVIKKARSLSERLEEVTIRAKLTFTDYKRLKEFIDDDKAVEKFFNRFQKTYDDKVIATVYNNMTHILHLQEIGKLTRIRKKSHSEKYDKD